MSREKNKVSLETDKHNLDEEWVEQPVKYYEAATNLADARKEWEEAKSRLEIIRCELDVDIRSDPEKYGISKLSEARIVTLIGTRLVVKEAQKEVIEARHNMDVWDAFVSAMDHRKTALSKLVDLLLMSYYSKPKASEGAKEYTTEVERGANRSGRDRRKK